MRALVADGSGGVRWSEVPGPAGGGSVVVEVDVVSVNRGEAVGLADQEPGTRVGWDFAGVVVDGGDSGWVEGSRVLGVGRDGTWAERIAVQPGQLGEVPAGLDLEVAAALALPALTASRALGLAGRLTGRLVAVVGAGGAVGGAAVQLAAAAGARVAAVARTGDSARPDRWRSRGAVVVVADIGDLPARPDVVLDSVGGQVLSAALDAVAPSGSVISFGTTSREPSILAPYWFGGHAGAVLHGYVVFADIAAHPAGADLSALARRAHEGALVIDVGTRIHADDIEALNAAIAAVAAGGDSTGKRVVWVR